MYVSILWKKVFHFLKREARSVYIQVTLICYQLCYNVNTDPLDAGHFRPTYLEDIGRGLCSAVKILWMKWWWWCYKLLHRVWLLYRRKWVKCLFNTKCTKFFITLTFNSLYLFANLAFLPMYFTTSKIPFSFPSIPTNISLCSNLRIIHITNTAGCIRLKLHTDAAAFNRSKRKYHDSTKHKITHWKPKTGRIALARQIRALNELTVYGTYVGGSTYHITLYQQP